MNRGKINSMTMRYMHSLLAVAIVFTACCLSSIGDISGSVLHLTVWLCYALASVTWWICYGIVSKNVLGSFTLSLSLVGIGWFMSFLNITRIIRRVMVGEVPRPYGLEIPMVFVAEEAVQFVTLTIALVLGIYVLRHKTNR